MEVDLHSQLLPEETPLVSIIMPVFNRAHLIGETLDSISTQTYTNWECIIVDDGSTDDTDTVVGKYVLKDARFKYYHRPVDRHKGANACRNYGFERSNGEYVNWFDSDDLMKKNFVSKKVFLLKHPNTDVVFCGYSKFGETLFKDTLYNVFFSGDIIDDLITKKVVFITSTFMIKKAVLQDKRFDESILKSQDLEFFFRLFSSNPKITISNIPEELYLIRKHSESISVKTTKKGYELKSKLTVHKRILHYFIKNDNFKGAKRYFLLCMIDFRLLLSNKNHFYVLKETLFLKEITSVQKAQITIYVLYAILSGKVIEIEKKIKFKSSTN